MKVNDIRLTHYKGFEDLTIRFPDEAQILVFIGENGSGKTSLLDGISLILRDLTAKYHAEPALWNDFFSE